jgi:transketolase
MNYEEIIKKISLNNEKLIILTAENRVAIRNLPISLKEKFIDTGITEQALIGISAGLALRGRIPVAHALAAFLTMRAYEFIRTDIGYGNLPVKIVGYVPGFLSEANGPTHQAVEDIALMRTIPNMNIFCPADEEDMLICLPEVIESNSPFYIRYNNLKPTITHQHPFQIGEAEIIDIGEDVNLIVYGFLFKSAYEAKIILEEKGLSVGLINLRTVKPIDKEIILSIANKNSIIVTIEDHYIIGGLYSILAELLLENHLSCEVFPIALKNKWFRPALINDVLDYEGFTGSKIANKIINIWDQHAK